MSSKPITTKTVEEFLLAEPKVYSLSNLMYAFVGTDIRHEKRLKEIIAKLLQKNVIIQVTAKTSASGIIGDDLCQRFGISLTEPRYFHVLKGHEILELMKIKA